MNNKRKKIIFIYEGVKAEENLLNNMVRIFFSSKTDVFILNCPAEGNIYMLWARMKKDEFNTDVVNVRPVIFLKYIFSSIMMDIITIFQKKI